MMRVLVVLAFLCTLIGAPAAQAGPLAEFNAKVDQVNQPYKSALFYLSTGNTGVAGLELAGAAANWRAIVTQYGAQPPDPYADDPDWQTTVDAISAAFDAGAKRVEQGDAKAARAALLPLRDHLHALRRRNGVRVLADCIYDLNAQMDVLYHYRHNPPDLSKLPERNAAKRASAIYAYILEECSSQAPRTLREDADFKSVTGGAATSAGNLFRPIDDQDETGLINVLRELKSFDVIIFVRWG